MEKNIKYILIGIIPIFFCITLVSFLIIETIHQEKIKYENEKKENKNLLEDIITPTKTPTIIREDRTKINPEPITFETINPLQNINYDYETLGDNSPCQPESFDPQKIVYSKTKSEENPSQLYEFKLNDIQYQFDINGWLNENELIYELKSPYKLTNYTFGCASSFSYVLEITKSNERQEIFQNVDSFNVLDDNVNIYIQYNEKNNDIWTKYYGIYNIENDEFTKLPINYNCYSDFSSSSNEYLITWDDFNNKREIENTNFCIFDTKGELQLYFYAQVDWSAAARFVPAFQIERIQENIIGIYTAGEYIDGEIDCNMYFINHETKKQKGNILFTYEDYHCPDAEFDFNDIENMDNGKLKFRYDKGYDQWSDWIEITLNN